MRSSAKRLGPSCCAQAVSTSATASRITGSRECRGGEGDALGAQVVGIRSALEVAEPLELAEQVVEGLLADPEPGGQLGGPRALRPGVPEDVQVRRVEVVEAALVQPLEHVPLDRFPGVRRRAPISGGPNGFRSRRFSKAT